MSRMSFFSSLTSNPFLIFSIIIVVWLTAVTFLLFKTIKHYRQLISKSKKKDLQSLLERILKKTEKHNKVILELDKDIKSIQKQTRIHLQKIGFVRFNPFSDTGGDQSFCLSILDEKDNGIVLSSLHSRGQTRLYAKKVEKGKGHDFELSKEEQQTIKKAKKGK